MEMYFWIGGIVGYILGWTVKTIIKITNKANAFEWELHEHKLEMKVRKENVTKNEKETTEIVTKQFTKKLSEIVSDNIVCEDDLKRDMVVYSAQVWTKFS